jgi:DNA-directed RNA polymerase specialized sigma24 family protein
MLDGVAAANRLPGESSFYAWLHAIALNRARSRRRECAGANVMLLVPFDDVVFERTSKRDGLTVVALSQLAVDLLTSPGRGPSEAEAILPIVGGGSRD